MSPNPSWTPNSAFVLAAGLGTRMRPLTDHLPKPLVPLAGRPLLDHVLDRIAGAGVPRAVVYGHFRADQIEAHLAGRRRPEILISDERGQLLETGGGLRKAWPLLGKDAVLTHNSDSVWIERDVSNLRRMFGAWDASHMDALLLLADRETSLGYAGRGDFARADDGRLVRVGRTGTVPFVFAGASIAHPRLFDGTSEGAFSLNTVWDRARAAGRLFGIAMHGTWMHVGDPGALVDAERLIARETTP